jgi:glycosyltransferase involved in cell wall biosynthesis
MEWQGSDMTSAPEHLSLKVLLVCTRDPRGRMSGRKMVLRTITESLSALGHQVTVAYFGAAAVDEAAPATDSHRYIRLPDPSPVDRLSGALRWLFRGSISLNEALYRSARAASALATLAREAGADVIITDMLRTAHYGAVSGLPWVADLDDLLSRRYTTLAAGYNAQTNLLGYYDSRFGRLLLGYGAWLMPLVLRREAKATARREVEVAQSAHVTTLVSATEAEALSRNSGRRVFSAPMAVEGPATLPPCTGRKRDLVFLGGLDYGPNLKSVLQFDRQIGPTLAGHGITDLKLHVIGHPAGQGKAFSDTIVLEGYVEDLDKAVQSYQAMLVPEVLPGGVKTKIIVAALNGTLVLAHRTALDGMGLEHGVDVLAWDHDKDLADLLRRLRQDEFDVGAITAAARHWASERYGREVLVGVWRDILAEAINLK